MEQSMRRIGGYEVDRLIGRTFVTTMQPTPFRVSAISLDAPDGGRLTLRAEDDPTQRVRLSARDFNRALMLGAIAEV